MPTHCPYKFYETIRLRVQGDLMSDIVEDIKTQDHPSQLFYEHFILRVSFDITLWNEFTLVLSFRKLYQKVDLHIQLNNELEISSHFIVDFKAFVRKWLTINKHIVRFGFVNFFKVLKQSTQRMPVNLIQTQKKKNCMHIDLHSINKITFFTLSFISVETKIHFISFWCTQIVDVNRNTMRVKRLR